MNSVHVIFKVLFQLKFSLFPFDFLVWVSEEAQQINNFSLPRAEI